MDYTTVSYERFRKVCPQCKCMQWSSIGLCIWKHGLRSFLHRQQHHYCTVDAGGGDGPIHVIDILYLLMIPPF